MKSLKKAISLFLVLLMVTSVLTISAFAAIEHDSYSLNGASVTVDGSKDVTVDVTFKKASGTTLLKAFGGYFSLSETEDSSYLSLTTLTPGSNDVTIDPVTQENDVVSGHISWTNIIGVTIEENAPIWTATYTVDKNTPTGEYTVSLTQLGFTDGAPLDKLSGQTYTATINVTYEDSSVAATGAALSQETASVSVGETVSLTAALLPADTTETVSSVAWESNNTAVATVENGVVTAVAAGEATITVVVTTDKGNTFNAACTVTVTSSEQPTEPVESSYTVTIADDIEGTAQVHKNDTVAMDVTVTGGGFNAFDLYVTYDTDAFTFAESANDTNTKVEVESGVVHIQNLSKVSYDEGTKVATLSFTANDVTETTTGQFGFRSAVVQSPADADKDIVPSKTVVDRVTVVKQYTVTFQDKDGNVIEGGICTVDDGASVETVPDAPAVPNYTFDKWYVGDAGYTADEIKTLAVTADVTYKAVYAANSYGVTLGAGLTGNETATYGTSYTGSIEGFDSGYTYTVTYQAGTEGETKNAVVDTTSGTFTIPGTDIVGALTVSVTKTLSGIAVTTHENFITGHTLIEVKGDENNYSYDGNDMYYVAASGENYGSFVYLVKGAADLTKIEVSANDKTEISTDQVNDVNMTGAVDFSDANAAFCIYNRVDVWSLENETTVDKLMEKIIRADVNRDYVVDGEDVTAILDVI